MTKINSTKIFAHNAVGTFFGGYRKYDDPIIWIVHSVLLPISVTVGAGIKTLIDVKSRHEINDEELKQIDQGLENLKGSDFDAFIYNVTQYPAKSNASRLLITNLREERLREQALIDEYAAKEKYHFLENKLNEFKKVNEADNNLPYVRLEVNTHCSLTEDDKQILNDKIKPYIEQQENERRNKQRDLIKIYLHDEINAGKKMQHIIKDEVSRGLRPC